MAEEPLSPGQRAARYKAYEYAYELVDHAAETITNEAIFTEEEAERNSQLIAEVHSTLGKRMMEFDADEADGDG